MNNMNSTYNNETKNFYYNDTIDISSFLEFSSFCEEIWKNDNLIEAIKTFILYVHAKANLTFYILLQLNYDKHKKLNFFTHTLDIPIQVFDDAALANLKSTIQNIEQYFGLKEEFSKGLNQIFLNEQYVCFLFLKTEDLCYVLAFVPQYVQTFKQNYILYDFLAKELQRASVILTKLNFAEKMLYKDHLTGVYNSRYLELIIDTEIKRSQRFNLPFSLLFIDIDNFKSINDTHGHLVGSSLLKQVSEVLKLNLREIDSIIRYGGDEFVILLLGSTVRSAFVVAERIRKSVESHRFIIEDCKHPIQVTVSIGIANYPEHAHSKKELLKIADLCMYESKKSGKNKVHVFKIKQESTIKNTELIISKDYLKS